MVQYRFLMATLCLALGLMVGTGRGQASETKLTEYEILYKAGNYEAVINRVEPLIKAREKSKETILTNEDVVQAQNLLADSYRMLGKYGQAGSLYAETIDGYFDPYAKYSFSVMQRVASIVGNQYLEAGPKPNSYTGRLGSKPLREKVLGELLTKLLEDTPLSAKRQYFHQMASYDKNADWVTKLTEFCAGELPLEDLLPFVSTDFLGTVYTYAGLSFEVAGNIAKARELYERALAQKGSNNIELLLAANRLGRFALKMIYTKEEPSPGYTVISLSDIYAVKASSAKLEENRLYSARNLIDSNPKTAWVAAGDNGGIGEWVEFSFDEPRYIKDLQLVNGYAKSATSFNRNNRVKGATLSFSDGTKSQISLEDTPFKQSVPIGKKVQSVRLTINDVYKGTAYNDTCLSEIEVEF